MVKLLFITATAHLAAAIPQLGSRVSEPYPSYAQQLVLNKEILQITVGHVALRPFLYPLVVVQIVLVLNQLSEFGIPTAARPQAALSDLVFLLHQKLARRHLAF